MYQRHLWRSEGFHGEVKTWHGLARAVRRGLDNMKIQSYLTAAAINLKRLAAALVARLCAVRTAGSPEESRCMPIKPTHAERVSGPPPRDPPYARS